MKVFAKLRDSSKAASFTPYLVAVTFCIAECFNTCGLRVQMGAKFSFHAKNDYPVTETFVIPVCFQADGRKRDCMRNRIACVGLRVRPCERASVHKLRACLTVLPARGGSMVKIIAMYDWSGNCNPIGRIGEMFTLCNNEERAPHGTNLYSGIV